MTGWWTPDETHDPALTSWVPGADGHPDFPVQNLPLGVFSPAGGRPRAGTAIGGHVLDLAAAAACGLLPNEAGALCGGPTLNRLLGAPAEVRRDLRRCLSRLLSDQRHRPEIENLLHHAADCTLHLPAQIGDYSDFYVGIHHATNIGRQFRPDSPLLPNYKHVPIGYHGRASSIRPSGVPVVRPHGQRKTPDMDAPAYGPSTRLDYELELGVWIGEGNLLGTPVPIGQAPRHIAGLCLLNDWSARDLQAWEYQPLGPFLSKSFHSTISPWIVTADALAPFRIAQPPRPAADPRPQPYLWDEADQAHGALSLQVEVHLASAAMRAAGTPPLRLSKGEARHMYWTIGQIVTHQTANGCNLQPGDLLGTGTLSAPTPDGYGSLLELTEGGARPLALPTGEERRFLEDGDEVTLSATAQAEGFVPIGFGPCRARVEKAA